MHRLISVETQETHGDSSLLSRIHRLVAHVHALWENNQLALRTGSALSYQIRYLLRYLLIRYSFIEVN